MTDISGDWHGVLDTGHTKVKLGLRFDGDTVWMNRRSGAVDPLPLRRDDGGLAFELTEVGLAFALRLDGDRLVGACCHNAVDFPVAVARGVASLAILAARPQTPRPPFPYDAAEVAFTGADGSRLAGTLTRPPGPGPHRVIVLSTWHGPIDRDQTVAGHRPFALWADHLTRAGFATLRYDKRGVGASEGRFDTTTTGDSAADLACAVAFVRSLTGLSVVGLLGHSEGGHISADVAAADPAIAFCVMMTPTGLHDGDILETELFRAAQRVGGVPRDPGRSVAVMRDLLAASRATTPAQSLALARKVLTAEGGLPQQIEARAAIAASPWSRFWARYEPTASLRQLNCPTLVVFAEMDLQTTPQVHAPAIAAANRDACAVTLAGLNHALQPAITGAPSEYREIATTVAPEALSIVCDWIEKVALA